MNALADQRLTGVIQMGDAFDLETLSVHSKYKPSANTLQAEIKGGRQVRRDMDSLADEKYITLGNHENRLVSFIMKVAPQLFDEVSVDKLFGLTENGWEITPYLDSLQIGKMIFTHCVDPQMVGINAVRTSGQIAGKSITIGHVHRLVLEYFGKMNDKHFVAFCPGWLGSTKAAEYMSKIKIYSSWMQGFGLIHFEDNGNFHLTPIGITDGKCALNGKIYRG